MNKWAEIRRLVFVEGKRKQSVCRHFGIHWDALNKILEHNEPPGYRPGKPRSKRKSEPYLGVIEELLRLDKNVHRKRRHTKRRIFERLRDEHGYPGGYTAVNEVVRQRQGREVFMPPIHPPGEAQVDFKSADIIHDDRMTKVSLFVMTLLYTREVLVVGENDGKESAACPGGDGAVSAAKKPATSWGTEVSWALPPEPAKDVRHWLQRKIEAGLAACRKTLLLCVAPVFNR